MGGLAAPAARVEGEACGDGDPDHAEQAEDRADHRVGADRRWDCHKGGAREAEEEDQADAGAIELHCYSSHSRRMRPATSAVAAANVASAASSGSASSVEHSNEP